MIDERLCDKNKTPSLSLSLLHRIFFAGIYPSCTKFVNHADETENIEIALQNSNMVLSGNTIIVKRRITENMVVSFLHWGSAKK